MSILNILVLVFLSAFFSSSETAIFSLDSLRLKRMQRYGQDTSLISSFLSQPTNFLITITIGNMLVNVYASSLGTSLSLKLFGERGLWIAIIFMSTILLIFGEIIPKTIAIYNPERISLYVAPLLKYFSKAVYPLRYMLNTISKHIIKILKIELKKEPTLTEEELKAVLDYSHRLGVVETDEKEMIRSVLEFTDTQAQEIMTPRIDIKALDLNTQRERLLTLVKNIKHSKIPVFKGTIDNIVGVVYTKELFFNPDSPLEEMVHPTRFIPPTKKISELLKEMNRENAKIVIVIDEYGGTHGLITLEDILEEIVGEIYDEFETKENLLEKISENQFRINGKTPVEEINKTLKINIPLGDYETIAGYILNLWGKIPREGESLVKNGYEYRIEKLIGKRIKSILLRKV